MPEAVGRLIARRLLDIYAAPNRALRTQVANIVRLWSTTPHAAFLDSVMVDAIRGDDPPSGEPPSNSPRRPMEVRGTHPRPCTEDAARWE